MAASRKIFPLSVVPGGVVSAEELARARRIDRVVAAHYASFGAHPHVERSAQNMLVYVSYRRREHIYWTRSRRRIAAGETLLVDGARMARTRCGNQLSLQPQLPIEPSEPSESILNVPQPVVEAPQFAALTEPDIPEVPVTDLYVPALPSLGQPQGPAITSQPVIGLSGPGILPAFFGAGLPGALARTSSTAPPTSLLPAAPPAASNDVSSSSVPIGSTSTGGGPSVPSGSPSPSVVPEPNLWKVMLLILVSCLVLLRLRKWAGTD